MHHDRPWCSYCRPASLTSFFPSPASHQMSSSDLELHILTLLASSPIADTQHLATSMGVDHQALVGCVKSLEADEYVRSEVVARQEFAVEWGWVGKSVAYGAVLVRCWCGVAGCVGAVCWCGV